MIRVSADLQALLVHKAHLEGMVKAAQVHKAPLGCRGNQDHQASLVTRETLVLQAWIFLALLEIKDVQGYQAVQVNQVPEVLQVNRQEMGTQVHQVQRVIWV